MKPGNGARKVIPIREKVGIRRIRLALARERVSANVGTFFAADKILASWAARSPGPRVCEFEIVYDDGHTLTGEYPIQCRASTCQALTGFIRKTIVSLDEGRAKELSVRGLGAEAMRFFAHYETDDFASPL